MIYSILIISVPLIIRTTWNIIYITANLYTWLYADSLDQNDYRLPIFIVLYYSITNLLPLAAQYISVRVVIVHYNEKVKVSTFINKHYRKVIYSQDSIPTTKILNIVHQ
jgi:hypothetical protein